MRDFESAPEKARFCHLSCRLGQANHYLFAATSVVGHMHEEDVGREAKHTLFMLLHEIGEHVADAMMIKDQLMELHAPDQIIPRPDAGEPLETVAQ